MFLNYWESIFLIYEKISMMEAVRAKAFANSPVIIENFIRDHGGFYSSLYFIIFYK